MAEVTVGQEVRVSLSSLQAPGVGAGRVSVTGTVVAIDAAARLITVQLGVSFGRHDVVQVPAEQVSTRYG